MTPEAWAIVGSAVGIVTTWGGAVAWLFSKIEKKASGSNVEALRADLAKAEAQCAANDVEIKSICAQRDGEIKEWVKEGYATRVDTTRINGRLDAITTKLDDMRTMMHSILQQVSRYSQQQQHGNDSNDG